MPRKKRRARGRRPHPAPVPGELFAMLGPLGLSDLECRHLEDQAAAAAERGEEFRVVRVLDWDLPPGLLGDHERD